MLQRHPIASSEGDQLQKSNAAACIVILAKTILGAGMAALPRAYALLGLGLATVFILVVAYLTYFSIQGMVRASLKTGKRTYPDVVRALLGRPGGIMLEISIVLRCFGLLLVYEIVTGDILAGGGKGYLGLLCDALGADGGWCANRPLILGIMTLAVFAPLVSLRNLTSTAWSSYLGLAAVVIWAGVTLALVGAAAAHGALRPMGWAPDWALFGSSALEYAAQVFAVVPILATAYTCQMTVMFVAADLTPFSEERMALVNLWAVVLCTVLFLTVAIGSYALFGDDVQADVLVNLTLGHVRALVGSGAGVVLYAAVRVSFLLSIISIFPMQMWPLRQALCKLLFGRELHGWGFYAITYGTLAGVYAAALLARSVWGPLQLIGATAGALIAFIFPALLILRAERLPQAPHADMEALMHEQAHPKAWLHTLRELGAWVLIALGLLQFVAGTAVTFLPSAA
ncbi:hypothetical protein WJX81_001186 [Elliptochloris bilobata]|uniref:Amino acid transporter transmembrane domain-containing protein n=1 Tax=Elliptochloris bilobata TaxID=381761 RepID=A0AAW1RCG7_9CHLO